MLLDLVTLYRRPVLRQCWREPSCSHNSAQSIR